MRRPSIRAALGLLVAGLSWGCGSLHLPAALSPDETAEVQATSIPAVVGVERSGGVLADGDLFRILSDSGLFARVEWLGELDAEPDLVAGVRERCEENPTAVTPVFTRMTLGVVPTRIKDRYGFAFVFYAPATPARRVEIGCGPRHTHLFGWVATPLDVLPSWGLTRPEEHPRYARQVEVGVARKADELRRLLEIE